MNRYFDANATTRPCAESLAAWQETERNHWQNPSSLYPSAAAANRRLEDARERLADLLGSDEPERVIFTSGATEANNAVFAHFAKNTPRRRVLLGATEHPCVRESAQFHFGDSFEIIPSDGNGVTSLDSLRSLLEKDKADLVSVMAANNETGVLQPWREIRDLCAEAGVPFHCDAAQWLGKLPASDLGQCDFVTGSAHKFRGPKGVGFLLVPEDSNIRLQVGGPQELNRRAGTENLAGIASMLSALESTIALSESRALSTAKSRDAFESEITAKIPGILVAGKNAERLWNTSMLVMPEHGNLKWITRLGRLDFAASTGSACSAGKGKPSLTLGAMGFDFDQMGRALRFSADWETTDEDWKALADALVSIWEELHSNKKGNAPRGFLSNPLPPNS